DAGRRGAWAERPDAHVGELVDEAAYERRLRADHDKVALLVARQPHEARHILSRHVEARHAVTRDAGVAGRGQQLGALRAAEQGAHDRVLPPSPSDYQYAHRNLDAPTGRL